ncbi:MAG: 23S rRNA (adenine(2503)-C(2))-methyltransferase RlmN [Ignavibacteriales bacterium]|nr:23S rRNA (adenine(2503)-C(2))-methyltransferase RlmN [Ignavibacteriales bacterium]
MDKINLKGLTLKELEEFAVSNGESKFRGKQLFEWLYSKEAATFDEMTSISKALREKLSSIVNIGKIEIIESQKSSDGTIKYLIGLSDGKNIESVLIPSVIKFEESEEEIKRLTLCVSTQVGCPLDCKFCATGTMGLDRNLTAGEIIDQLIAVKKDIGKKITNLVYMGMGEPFLNYDNVMKSIEIISTGMDIAARRIIVSTVGLVPQIKQIADEKRKMKLAISLHSLDDKVRKEIMPIAKKHPLTDLIESIQYYYKKTRLRPTFEYILFDGVNDRFEDARHLIQLSNRIPCKVNIIPFHDNEITRGIKSSIRLKPSSKESSEKFIETLRKNHVTVFARSSAGKDINAACGQLVVGTKKIRKMQ